MLTWPLRILNVFRDSLHWFTSLSITVCHLHKSQDILKNKSPFKHMLWGILNLYVVLQPARKEIRSKLFSFFNDVFRTWFYQIILTEDDIYCKRCQDNTEDQYNKENQNVRIWFMIAVILKNSRHYCRTENKIKTIYIYVYNCKQI